MIRTVVVDDEAPARRRIIGLLDSHADIEVVGEAGSGREAVSSIRKLKPDLLFLDVQMPEGGGFDVLRSLDEDCPPAIIFVTAYDEFALRAFDSNAIDYLLKPYDSERFDRALQRVRRLLRSEESLPDQRLDALLQGLDRRRSPDRYAVRDAERIKLIQTPEIQWIQAAGKYVELYCGQRVHLLRKGIGEIEKELDPDIFIRIHRSLIVNLDYVSELRRWSGSEFLFCLKDGTQLRSGRSYLQAVKQLLGKE